MKEEYAGSIRNPWGFPTDGLLGASALQLESGLDGTGSIIQFQSLAP